jgi:hypothetical protein
MFSGPMFRYEYRTATRKRRPFVIRVLIALALASAALFVGFLVLTANTPAPAQDRFILLGQSVFVATFCLELLFFAFLVPALVGGSIAEERARDTLPLLLLTGLTRIEIVLTKTIARWLCAVSFVLSGLPVIVVSAWAAGLELELLLAMLLLLSSSAFMASLAILASASQDHAGNARAIATAWIFGWLSGPPILSIMPIRSAGLWGMLFTELKSLCALVAPSSPLSLVTDPGWFTASSPIDLESRVALMVGLQTVFGVLALASAASQLKARETNPNWIDPTRGYRPPCGDDPVFWREYELPMRRGGGSLLALRLRCLLILIKAVLINVAALAGVLLALAIPIGLVAATMYYGFGAFDELRQYGYSPDGPFVERLHFNLVVRAATGMLALLPAMIQTSLVGTRITAERDKKTWDTFLTTPLSASEILWSKSRVALTSLKTGWPLLVIWVLGLACGVVTPLGVFVAALDLVLVAWASLALGFYLSLRPDPTNVASSHSASSTLLLFVVHTALLAAALASPREIAEFGSWDWKIRYGLVLLGLTVMIATGATAWVLTRRALDRFDEWAGRPQLPVEPQPHRH